MLRMVEPAYIIERHAEAHDGEGRPDVRLLADWRDADAYVLLAEPGGGKTEAFKQEAAQAGGMYVTARDLTDLSPRPQWRDRILFIDGLDEMLADAGARGDAFGAIRKRLDELGRPRFRIACREADWLGSVNTDALRIVAPRGEVLELRLQPLNEAEIKQLLRRWPDHVPDPDQFWNDARLAGVHEVLVNPLLLKLLVQAARGGKLPNARNEIYRLACERMVEESNPNHRASAPYVPARTDQILDDAGLLFAVMLLSGSEAVSLAQPSAAGRDVAVESLPRALGLSDAKAALDSNLFLHDGVRRLPRHRSIAEYLAARSIAGRVAVGLPISRVLALMSGMDGGIVEPLRGLNAWLAVHCLAEREQFIRRDPLGVVLYGDVRGFLAAQKLAVLDALRREAQRFAWFRSGQWASHPFGALGTSDMAGTYRDLLLLPNRDPAHQSLLDCVLDAVKHGDEMPTLGPAVERVVRDDTYFGWLRQSSLQLWLKRAEVEDEAKLQLLADLAEDRVVDRDDQLYGLLLSDLYPKVLGPDKVLLHFRAPKTQDFHGAYAEFWHRKLLESTPPATVVGLADAMAAMPEGRRALALKDYKDFTGNLICRALELEGDRQPVERVHAWLGLGLEANGFSRLRGDDGEGIRQWLSSRPDLQKRLLEHGFALLSPGRENIGAYYWRCHEYLHQARRPADWYNWLLEVAERVAVAGLAEQCFRSAARAAINALPDFSIRMEDVEQWVAADPSRWSQDEKEEWRKQEWSSAIDPENPDSEQNWQQYDHRQNLLYEAEQNEAREKRRAEVAPFMPAVREGTAPPGLLHDIAFAYAKRFSNIRGATPQHRVQDFLGVTPEEVPSVLSGMEATLQRSDIPAAEEILQLHQKGRYHLLRSACLLGAVLSHEHDADASLLWPESVARSLVAFHLTENLGEPAHWYTRLAHQQPSVVASVLLPYATWALKQRKERIVSGVWSLAQDPTQAELARMVLPELLRRFPARAGEAQMQILNGALIPATKHIPSDELISIVRQRLALRSLDAGQRIAWQMLRLRADPEADPQELLNYVGTSQARAEHVGRAVQGDRLGDVRLPLPRAATALGKVVEVLAPYASPEEPLGGFWVGESDHRRENVRMALKLLAASTDAAASQELRRLRHLPALKRWTTEIDGALHDQTRLARVAKFSHAEASNVALVLANEAPASPLDLAALGVDALKRLGQRLRGHESNSLRLFWRSNPEPGKPLVPKLEEDCRDVLLELLTERLLAQHVQVDKEGRAAGDKRTDMRLSTVAGGQQLRVPVEIKLEHSREVWTAWRDQLDLRYTSDPAAQGTGIYLVLWFGVQPKSTDKGEKPRSTSHMEELLRERIPAEDRVRLSVVVLDLSWPAEG
jgi:hypothetical protein